MAALFDGLELKYLLLRGKGLFAKCLGLRKFVNFCSFSLVLLGY